MSFDGMRREIIMETLFAKLSGPPMVFQFTADMAQGDVTLSNVSDTTGMLVGMPINGDGIEENALLATIEPEVTMTLPATKDVSGSAITQGFQTTARRLSIAFEEADMPSMYLLDQGEEHPPRESMRPYLALMHCELFIFSKAGEDPNAVPATALNNLIDAIEMTLNPTGSQPGGGLRQPLGLHGVHYCRIEGEIQKDPGHANRIAGAIVPIRIAAAFGLVTAPQE
jgi:hypothetical protein